MEEAFVRRGTMKALKNQLQITYNVICNIYFGYTDPALRARMAAPMAESAR